MRYPSAKLKTLQRHHDIFNLIIDSSVNSWSNHGDCLMLTINYLSGSTRGTVTIPFTGNYP
jgi:hypothetical protein